MDMDAKQYGDYVRAMSPNSALGRDLLRAFLVGGAICALGQALILLYTRLGGGEAAERSSKGFRRVLLAARFRPVSLAFFSKRTGGRYSGGDCRLLRFSHDEFEPVAGFE